MDRITKKLIKYFISIITVVIVICFITSSIFLSKFYMNIQYNNLKANAEEIYSALKENINYENIGVSAVLVNNDLIIPIGSGHMMGRMNMMKNVDFKALGEKGTFKNPMNDNFIFYKLPTTLGDIVVFQNSTSSSEYLQVIYIILIIVFLMAILLCIPLISYVGKKFTKPILKLQRASYEIAKGNFNIDTSVHTKDEIEDLSFSLQAMASNLKTKYALQKSFIANVSHDFKTPLSVIRGYCEAYRDGLIDKDDSKHYSEEIIKEVDRLNSMVMDLLQLSKFQEGAFKLKVEEFSLKELMKNTVTRFTSVAKEKNIEIDALYLDVMINGDANYLSRVLYNFIDNAIKYSEPFGKVEVSAVYIGRDIMVSVIDHGIGINKEALNDIWNRYYKHSESGGMGLGLAICKEILRLHKFEFGVKSEENKGSEFYFIINKS